MDEAVFKAYKVNGKAWAYTGQNQLIGVEGVKLDTLALSLGISADEGVEVINIKEFAIKGDDVNETLERLNQRYPNRQLYLFMDNATFHHARIVQEKIRCLQWALVFNALYSPQFHCIEQVFARIKKAYR